MVKKDKVFKKGKVLSYSLLFSIPTITTILSTSCSINNDYLTDSADIKVYADSVYINAGQEYKIKYDDTQDYFHQATIKVVANCNQKTISEFSFVDLDSDAYPFLTKSNDIYDYRKNTVTTTYTFNQSASTLEWNEMTFTPCGYIGQNLFSPDSKGIRISSHILYNPIPFQMLFPLGKEMYGVSSQMIDSNHYTYLVLYDQFDKISDNAFSNIIEPDPSLSGIVSHILPATVKRIAPDPRADEDELMLTTIGKNAFSECNNLQMVEIPKTVDTLQTRSFYNSENISNIIIKQIQFIQPLAFGGLGNLWDPNIPNDFSGVDFDTDENSKLINTCGLKWYEQKDFNGRKIGEVLYDTKPYSSSTTPNPYIYPITTTGKCNWVMGSLGMGKIKIGGGDGLFDGIRTLETANISDSSDSKDIVGSFEGCSSLHEVVLGKSITNIQTVVDEHGNNIANIFKDCKNLDRLIITDSPDRTSTLPLDSVNGDWGWLKGCNENIKIFVPESLVSLYKAQWTPLANKIFGISSYGDVKWWTDN